MSITDSNRAPRVIAPFAMRSLPHPRVASPEGIVQFMGSMSISQWLLLAFPIIMAIIQRRRDPDDAMVVDSAALVQIGYTLLCLPYLLFRLNRLGAAVRAVAKRPPVLWMILFALLAVLSTAWSDFPKLTAFRALQYIVFTGLVVDTLAHLQTVERIGKLLLIYGLLICLFFQLGGLRYELSVGAIRAPLVTQTTGMVVFLALMLKGKAWRLLFAAMCFSVVFGQSSATNSSVLAALVALPIAGRASKYRIIGTLMILFIAVVAIYNLDEITGALFPGKSMREITTLTGRLPMWEWFFREAFPLKPLLGYGFGVGENIARFDNVNGLRATHMHNILISALANLGLVGGMFTVLLLGSALWIALTLRNPSQSGPVCAATIVAVLNSFSVVSVTSPLSLGWISSALMFGLLAMSRLEHPLPIYIPVSRLRQPRPF